MRQRGIDKVSLCFSYDFEKWLMISLSIVAITLIIGLVSLAYGHITYGYIDPNQYGNDQNLTDNIAQVNYWEKLVNYCFEHADRPNPLQDLKDKGFSVIGTDCKQVNQLYDEQLDLVNKMIADYNKKQADYKIIIFVSL